MKLPVRIREKGTALGRPRKRPKDAGRYDLGDGEHSLPIRLGKDSLKDIPLIVIINSKQGTATVLHPETRAPLAVTDTIDKTQIEKRVKALIRAKDTLDSVDNNFIAIDLAGFFGTKHIKAKNLTQK